MLFLLRVSFGLVADLGGRPAIELLDAGLHKGDQVLYMHFDAACKFVEELRLVNIIDAKLFKDGSKVRQLDELLLVALLLQEADCIDK